MFNHFGTITACDEQTDERTHGNNRPNMASRTRAVKRAVALFNGGSSLHFLYLLVC